MLDSAARDKGRPFISYGECIAACAVHPVDELQHRGPGYQSLDSDHLRVFSSSPNIVS
jgi:hypothetical protein